MMNRTLMLCVLMAKAGEKNGSGGGKTGTAVVSPAENGAGTDMIMVQDKVPDHIRQGQKARGSESVTTDDVTIPRLEVLQPLSPEVDEEKDEYIEGARPGMLINSVTKQIYGSEVFVCPVIFKKQWLVWRHRDFGGGLQGVFNDAASAEAKVEELKKGDGKAPGMQGVEAIDTPQHFCLILNRDKSTLDEIIVSMPRTKAKVSRQWNSMIKLAGGDRFARVYRIGTQTEKNAKGEYKNFVVSSVGYAAQKVYAAAEALYESVTKGQRDVVMDVKGMKVDEDPAPGGDSEM